MSRVCLLAISMSLLVLLSSAHAESFQESTADCTWVGYWNSDPFSMATPAWNNGSLEVQGGLASNARSQRVLVRWDLSVLADALSVENATLTMHVAQSDHQAGAKVGAYAVTPGNNWITSEATYSQLNSSGDRWQGTGTVGASAGGDTTYPGNWMWGDGTGAPVNEQPFGAGPMQDYYLSWDVTAIVRDWLINGMENNGIALAMSQHVSSSTDYCHFSNPNAGALLNQYPVLEIEYTVDPCGTYEAKTADATWVGYSGSDPAGSIATTAHWNDALLEAQGGVNSESRSQRVLIRYDLSALADLAGVVNSATLTMHVANASKQDSAAMIAAYAVSSGNDWAKTKATYQRIDAPDEDPNSGIPWQGTGQTGASAGGDATYPGNWLNGPADGQPVTIGTDYDQTFDVTSIVQDWLVNGVQNNGFVVGFSQYTSSSTDYVYFRNPNGNHPTTWPSLQINYTPAADLPPTNCDQAISRGYGKASDLNDDCRTDLLDLGVMASEWLDCVDPADANCEEPWLQP